GIGAGRPKPASKQSVRDIQHWKSSSSIDLGLYVSHKLSDKSLIHYPALHSQKRVSLPAICPGSYREKRAAGTDEETGMKPYILSPATVLPGLEYKAEEDVSAENDQWLQLQQSSICHAVYLQSPNEDMITIKAGCRGDSVTVPASVVRLSTTMEHILQNSAGFKESASGLMFPDIPPKQFAVIIEYLNRLLLQREKVDTSMYSPFDIPSGMLLDVMEHALYLDLSGLVDKCARLIASQFEKIDSFGNLPFPLIRMVLKQVSIGELVLAEHHLVPHLDLSQLWSEKCLKLMSSDTLCSLEWQSDNGSPDFLQSKRLCLEFYMAEVLGKIGKDPELEGKLVRQLAIHIDGMSDRLDLGFWMHLVQNCTLCQCFKIRCHQLNASLP
ncbi:hypothetical protein HDU91_003330, partial [Kappamyces sp. JEL0680]